MTKQVADSTNPSTLADYPLRGTRAQSMLEGAMKAAQAAGRSQSEVAKDLNYKTSVVLSHMTAGRVPIPIDRAKDIAKALGLDPKWAYQTVAAVGNYGEIFERHLGKESALRIDRGLNRLWNHGGLIYAPPVR